jgi:hypothetical protein
MYLARPVILDTRQRPGVSLTVVFAVWTATIPRREAGL